MIDDEKSKWENEKKMINDLSGNRSDILKLNISGLGSTMVKRSILTSVPETSLEALFSGKHPV